MEEKTELSTIEENTNGTFNESPEFQKFKVEDKEIRAVEKKSAGHSVKFVITQAIDEYPIDPRYVSIYICTVIIYIKKY